MASEMARTTGQIGLGQANQAATQAMSSAATWASCKDRRDALQAEFAEVSARLEQAFSEEQAAWRELEAVSGRAVPTPAPMPERGGLRAPSPRF